MKKCFLFLASIISFLFFMSFFSIIIAETTPIDNALYADNIPLTDDTNKPIVSSYNEPSSPLLSFNSPNIEASAIFDNTNSSFGTAMTSVLLRHKIGFEFRIGYIAGNEIKNTFLASLCYDLKKLNDLGINVEYAWSDSLNLSIGLWYGIDIKESLTHWGLMATVIKVKF